MRTHSAPMPPRKMALLVKRLLPSTLISALAASSGMVMETEPVDSTLYFTMPLNVFWAMRALKENIMAKATVRIFFIIFYLFLNLLLIKFHIITRKGEKNCAAVKIFFKRKYFFAMSELFCTFA